MPEKRENVFNGFVGLILEEGETVAERLDRIEATLLVKKSMNLLHWSVLVSKCAYMGGLRREFIDANSCFEFPEHFEIF